MKSLSIVLGAVICELVSSGVLCAQPILNRVERLLRDQVGAAQNPDARGAAEPGYLGLVVNKRQGAGRGVQVVDVVAGGPAAQSGVQKGDVITSIDGRPILAMDDMAQAIEGKPVGARLTISVQRNGVERDEVVVLGRRVRPLPAGKAPEELPGPSARPAGPTDPPPGPRLGVRTSAVTEDARRQNNLSDTKGAVVILLAAGSPAERAGIPLGAVITAVDNQAIDAPQDLVAAVRGARKDQIELTYVQAGAEVRKTVFLSEPASTAAGGAQVRGRPVAPRPRPSEAPALNAPAQARIEALEARIRELEERIEKLEARRATEGAKESADTK